MPISFAILEDYDKGDPLSDVARDFALFKDLCVTVWRGSFGWDDYEPEPGKFDFAWLREFAALADSTGISLRRTAAGGSPSAFHTVKMLLRLFGTDSITVADNELTLQAPEGTTAKLYHHLFIRPDRRQLVFVWTRAPRPPWTSAWPAQAAGWPRTGWTGKAASGGSSTDV